MDLATFDPFAPELRADPHPHYHRLRDEAPYFEIEGPVGRETLLTRYDDCLAVLRDPRWSSSPDHRPPVDEGDERVRLLGSDLDLPVLLILDPPDHTRLRRLVSKAFTPRTIERLREHVVEIFDDLMAEPTERGELELEVVGELGYTLPVTVICELMGVPVEDRFQFQDWSSDASRMLDGDIDEATAQRGVNAIMQFVAYFTQLFEARRTEPGDDLISGLLAVEDEGDTLSQAELYATVLLIFVAGHETTMNLIGNGLHALLSHRDQWVALVADPSLAAGAVEECLRYDGPVHLTARTASQPLTLGERSFERGESVVCLLAAANRDPAQFADPDRFDITRADNHHLTFSHGMHYCLGAALARLEGQVVFTELASRFPDLRLLTTAPRYRDHFVLRGLDELRVALA